MSNVERSSKRWSYPFKRIRIFCLCCFLLFCHHFNLYYFLIISSAILFGTGEKWLGSIEYVARPEVRERSCVEYPNISLRGTSAWTIAAPLCYLLTHNLAAAAVKVPDHIAHVSFRRCDIDLHDRF